MQRTPFLYVLRRLLHLAPVVLLSLVINFTLVRLAPGDPVYVLAGDSGNEAYYALMRARLGLDRPLPEQLVRYLANTLRGDFGYSYAYGQPVMSVILERVPATLLLMLSAQVVAVTLGVSLGAVAALRGHRLGAAIRSLAALGYSLPVFWFGQLLILAGAFTLGLFPVYGMASVRGNYTGLRHILDVAHHLVLPVMALSVAEIGLLTRIADTAMREAASEQYVLTATAKGLPASAVAVWHILRNALLPITTVIGGQLGGLLTGAVLVETVFAWPGLGRLLYEATLSRDYPLLMAMFFVASLGVVLFNLITDLIYTRLDPRVVYR